MAFSVSARPALSARSSRLDLKLLGLGLELLSLGLELLGLRLGLLEQTLTLRFGPRALSDVFEDGSEPAGPR